MKHTTSDVEKKIEAFLDRKSRQYPELNVLADNLLERK